MGRKNIYLLMGSNLGDRRDNLRNAESAISNQIGSVRAASAIYETEAWGKTDQPAFLNQVLEVDSEFTPEELLIKLLSIEKELGRDRTQAGGRWAPRVIDLDILYFGEQILHSPALILPHPGIPDRRFTLVPLTELAPDFVHPELRKTNEQLLRECYDLLKVSEYRSD